MDAAVMDLVLFGPELNKAEIDRLRPMQARLIAACGTNDRPIFSAQGTRNERVVILHVGNRKVEIPTDLLHSSDEAIAEFVANNLAGRRPMKPR